MKTIKEINEKIRKGDAVVVTAEEIIDLVEKKGIKKAAKDYGIALADIFVDLFYGLHFPSLCALRGARPRPCFSVAPV
jgi:hypothetical protein